jgi:thiamine biosynthesis lipoprotein
MTRAAGRCALARVHRGVPRLQPRLPHAAAAMTRAARRPLLVLALLAAGAVPAPGSEVARARWLMGTLFTARSTSADTLRAGAALDAALDSVAALESRLSNWRPTSELCRLNAAGGGHASAASRAVIDSALALAALTAGAFDPTVEPLTRAYDLRGHGRMPAARELAAARARVDWRLVTLTADSGRLELHAAQLDLAGIAKGFALDHAARVLVALGVADAILDAGGQIRVMGERVHDVWVAQPERRDVPAVRLRVRAGSLATSAQSEHSMRVHGRRVGHVLDPRTGVPLRTRASVSVFAASGTRADALSTALLVMGRDTAGTFAKRHPELGVLWLEPTGRRVHAFAWNLDIAEITPAITLTHTNPQSQLARIP